jgi:hypothetical protein
MRGCFASTLIHPLREIAVRYICLVEGIAFGPACDLNLNVRNVLLRSADSG